MTQKHKFLFTVFTPTYNRGYIIGKLYESLCRQSFRDFEWIVVDDGSTDDTGTLIAKFVAEDKIPIRFIRQENGGKHRAINRGVREAQGELFFIVDSDDHLADNALERTAWHYSKICGNSEFCGVSGLRMFPNGEKIGGEENWSIIDATAREIRTKYGVKGDLAEVWKTEILARFPFPEIEGETFCGEMLVWRRIARAGYKLRFFYEKIYVCEYLSDGLTRNSKTTDARGRKASVLCRFECFNDISWKEPVAKLRGGGDMVGGRDSRPRMPERDVHRNRSRSALVSHRHFGVVLPCSAQLKIAA